MCRLVGTATVSSISETAGPRLAQVLTYIIELLQRALFCFWNPKENHTECNDVETAVGPK